MGTDTDSGLGFAYPGVDANTQKLFKNKNRRYCTNLDGQSPFLQTNDHTFIAPNDQPWAERYPPWSLSLVENWNGQSKHWSPKMEGDKGLKSWLTHFYECVLKLNMTMSGTKGVSPWRDSSVFLVDLGRGGEELRW